MARVARHSRDELRELALAAAEQMLAEEGPENLTARRIAARIGYSVGSLYNSFASVDDLIRNLDARTLDILHDALAAAPRTGDPERDMHALLATYLRFIEDHAERWNLMFKPRPPGAGDPPDWYMQRVDRLFRLLEEILAPLFPPGEEPARARAARLHWLALHGVWSLHVNGQLGTVTGESMEDVARGMSAMILAGLRADSR